MATRNLTQKFEGLRSSNRRGSLSVTNAAPLLSPGDQADDRVAIQVGLGHSLPPVWVDIVEGIQDNVAEIKEKCRQLEDLHTARLKVSFGQDESAQEREIEILTNTITRIFGQSENSLKRIATIGNAKGTNLPAQERLVRLNVMRSLALEIQTLSKQFRHQQKDFVLRLKGQEEVGSDFFVESSDSKQPLSFEEAVERGFTPENMQQLKEMEKDASQREREIIKIAQSINDLASLFRELSVLIIEQGSIVDRIDYNVEMTLSKVKEANVELNKANEYSKKARTMVCILVLIVICAILLSIFIYKQQN